MAKDIGQRVVCRTCADTIPFECESINFANSVNADIFITYTQGSVEFDLL